MFLITFFLPKSYKKRENQNFKFKSLVGWREFGEFSSGFHREVVRFELKSANKKQQGQTSC